MEEDDRREGIRKECGRKGKGVNGMDRPQTMIYGRTVMLMRIHVALGHFKPTP